MPTYQYRCTECGRDLEVVQKFSDASLTECPTCAGALRKVFNAVGVVFKGSGFYRNDSRAGAGKNGSSDGGAGKNGNADGGSDKKSADATGDSKPVTTDASKTADAPTTGAPSKTETSRTEPKKSDSRPTVGAGSSTGSRAASN